MLPYQVKNIETFVKVPYRILVVDDSDNDDSDLLRISQTLDVIYWKIPSQQHKMFGEHPSARHQHALNTGLSILREMCTHILLFDNDMLFMNDFIPNLNRELWFLPQTRGKLIYPWLNLFLFSTREKIKEFEFHTCPETGETTDPGGNLAEFLLTRKEDCHFIKQEWASDMYYVEYQKKYRALCEQYQINPWYDIFQIMGTFIFHFRGLSNWQKFPDEFVEAKKKLILEEVIVAQNKY